MVDKIENEAALNVLTSHLKTYTFELDIDGYKGEFTVKYPSLIEQIKIGTILSKLTEGLNSKQLDTITNNIAFMSATLMVVVTKSPKWFNLNELDDYLVLDEIYGNYAKWGNSFRNRDKQGTDEDNSSAFTNEADLEDM